MPFRALGLEPTIQQAVTEAGYTQPTPIQAASIPLILEGRDLIGIAQTGTGKTAAFTLPMLSMLSKRLASGGPKHTRALILAPTRELVVQIDENLRTYAKHLHLKIAKVYGGVGERPQADALRNRADVVIATPGRLIDLMGQGHADFTRLEFLILDEADRMLDMGFLPPMRKIVAALPKKRQTLLFSATLSKEIERLTHEFQHNPKIVEIGRRTNTAETVQQAIYEVPKHLKSGLLTHLLKDESLNMVLVFSRTKHGADRIARQLSRSGIESAAIHGNRSQPQRQRALNDFKAGKVRVLVATDIAARGIDVDGISHVVNYDFPPATEDYIHRIGRTGRAQAEGDAISFITEDDRDALRALERFTGKKIERKVAQSFDLTAPAPPKQENDSPRGGGRPGGQNRQGGRPAPQKQQPKGQPRSDSPRGSGEGSGAPRRRRRR
jgi:ATP-dependent RNA helicase RhlE